MMDRIEKALGKLSEKEKSKVKEILRKTKEGNFDGLDIKKLKGRDNIFRVRKGSIRIIYRKDAKQKIFVLAIERRSDKTYKLGL